MECRTLSSPCTRGRVMTDIVERLRDADTTRRIGESYADTHERRQRDRNEAADEIERLRATLDTVRASGLLIGSTTLHDRVRSAVYNAIDANPAALEEACTSS